MLRVQVREGVVVLAKEINAFNISDDVFVETKRHDDIMLYSYIKCKKDMGEDTVEEINASALVNGYADLTDYGPVKTGIWTEKGIQDIYQDRRFEIFSKLNDQSGRSIYDFIVNGLGSERIQKGNEELAQKFEDQMACDKQLVRAVFGNEAAENMDGPLNIDIKEKDFAERSRTEWFLKHYGILDMFEQDEQEDISESVEFIDDEDLPFN